MWRLVVQHDHRNNEGDIHYHIAEHGNNADAHRGAGVLAGIVTRRQNLDKDKGGQSQHIGHQAQAGEIHIIAGELAITEQAGQYRHCQNKQTDTGRHRNQGDHAQRPVQGLVELGAGLAGVLA